MSVPGDTHPSSALERFAAAARAHGFKVPSGRATWRMRCPGHQGEGENLAVAAGDRGVLFTCHSHGCDATTIARAVGLNVEELFDAPARTPERAEWRSVAVYPYQDENGETLFEVVREERGERLPGKKPEKRFRQRHAASGGRLVWGLNGTRRVLFRLPQLLEAVAEERPVLVVEGEKCVLAAERLGVIATTAPMGAANWVKDGRDPHGFSDALRGAHVILSPDNDDKGRRHMLEVGELLSTVCASVRVLELPDLPAKGDVADWMEAGGDASRLAQLFEAAVPFSHWRRSLNELPSEPTDSDSATADEAVSDAMPGFRPLSDVDPHLALRYLIQDLFLEKETALVVGAGGVFKSTTLWHLAGAVASGGKAFGRFQAQEGTVCIVSGEDPEEVIRNRMEAICRGQGWNVARVLERVFILALGGVDLRSAKWRAHLLAALVEIKPRLVILDPLADLATGQENDNSERSEVVATWRSLMLPSNATVILCHHLRKQPNAGEVRETTTDDIRGASSVVNASRQTYLLDEGPDGSIRIRCRKFSRGGYRGTVREQFFIRPHIESAPDNPASWQSARFEFLTTNHVKFDAAERFVMSELAAGERQTTTQLKDLAKGTGVSGADIARVLKSLHMRQEIDFVDGPRGAKLWGATTPNATLPNDLGNVGKVENDIARQGDWLPGNVGDTLATLPSPYRGQGGKVATANAGQGQEAAQASLGLGTSDSAGTYHAEGIS